MSSLRFRTAPLSSLIEAYVAAAGQYGEATVAAKVASANRHADRIASIYRELRRRGSDSQSALLDLFKYTDEGVRLWAASHALEFAPSAAIPVLELISRHMAHSRSTSAPRHASMFGRRAS
jgi:hypothetical protein